MDKKSLYTEAYKILNHSTPLTVDCGKLCNRACCEGHGDDSGMILFPGEEVMYSPIPDWLEIHSVDWPYSKERKKLLAVCSGRCDRDLRPLACRIFPLVPVLSENDILQIKMDPRAVPVCPLAADLSRSRLNRDFISNVRKVFQILVKDEDIKQYMMELTAILEEYRNLPWFKLLK